MQAITTKYHGATNTKPARISARCQAGRITVAYNYGNTDAHDVAAAALIRKLEWHTDLVWIRGGLPDGTGNVYVAMPTGHGNQAAYTLDVNAKGE